MEQKISVLGIGQICQRIVFLLSNVAAFSAFLFGRIEWSSNLDEK